MIITYYGHSCFKIETKPGGRGAGERLNIYVDPFDSSVGLKPPSGKADLVLVTHDHHDHNNIKGLRGDYFLVNHPGEYTYRGISIAGFKTYHDGSSGTERGLNAVYLIESEDIKIAHLGDLGHPLDKDQMESMEGIDILMIPVGGTYTLSIKEAVELIKILEPAMIIPMHYKSEKTAIDDLKPASDFYAAWGKSPEGLTGKLVLKKNQIKEGEMAVIEMAIGNGNGN